MVGRSGTTILEKSADACLSNLAVCCSDTPTCYTRSGLRSCHCGMSWEYPTVRITEWG